MKLLKKGQVIHVMDGYVSYEKPPKNEENLDSYYTTTDP